GDGPVAPALGEKPTDLTQLAATHGEEFPLQAVVDAIDGTRTVRAHGVSEMPVWGEVFQPDRASPQQKLAARSKIIAIADYLRSRTDFRSTACTVRGCKGSGRFPPAELFQ